MTHSPKDALLAAKQDLLAAYSSVHHSLGRLIRLVHNSEPRVIADALGSEFQRHPHSPPPNHYSSGPNGQSSHGHPAAQYGESTKYPTTTPLYPAPPQPHSSANPRAHPPPGPSFNTVAPGVLRQLNHCSTQSHKPRQRKPQQPHSGHSYDPQAVQPLETDDDDEEEEDPEEPVSEEDHHINGAGSGFYNPPHHSPPIPTPPGSIPGGKKKRAKRERDPNAPKRPASAYILFQNAVRQEMRAANPTADYKELARQIGDRWKNLSEEAKRPWSEAGKLAMNSWNIQNKEYKTSHPDTTSPHHSNGGHQTQGAHKRRSRIIEGEELGSSIPKKRGRPSKFEKDPTADLQGHPDQLGRPQQLHSTAEIQSYAPNGHAEAPAPQSSISHAQPGDYVQPQVQEDEFSEEEEEDEEDEEEAHSHVPQTSFPQGHVNGGTAQAPPHMAPTDSELEEGEEDEGSAASATEPTQPMSTKMTLQPNGILT